jgi:hypothetical protein
MVSQMSVFKNEKQHFVPESSYECKKKLSLSFFFSFFLGGAALGVEVRVSHLLGRHSTT